ncbi:HAMP domain-containing protein, partial [bacterium]|nr:HAMP domain-containing protein [bacterium]
FANAFSPTLVFARVLDILWLPMLFSTLLGSILIVIISLFYSHRIAGPLYNLKRMMRQIEKGNLNGIMKIRKNDEFHDVEEAFNRMLTGLKNRQEVLEKAVANLSEPGKSKIEKILKPSAQEDGEF